MEAAEIAVNGDVVVVEDYKDIGLGGAGIVKALPGKAARHCTVSYHGNGLVSGARYPCGFGKTQRGRY